ncbi:type II toxin-antitoxin system VapC family toxin [Candidatus Poriferisocius sp.]|uniref:type II toxin-antitoxin system VapC family toxin n=1 Tax=Candidatus Poriferisocius sp. TaxID=3101276 RepID=UPI003B01CA2A
MIVADASWIVALRDPKDDHHREAVAINGEIAGEVALLHPITLAESLVASAKLGVLDEAASRLRAAFDVVDVDLDAPIRWALLRAETGLRLPDAIVLDTALRHRARAIATFDERLAARTVDRGFEVLGSQIA